MDYNFHFFDGKSETHRGFAIRPTRSGKDDKVSIVLPNFRLIEGSIFKWNKAMKRADITNAKVWTWQLVQADRKTRVSGEVWPDSLSTVTVQWHTASP